MSNAASTRMPEVNAHNFSHIASKDKSNLLRGLVNIIYKKTTGHLWETCRCRHLASGLRNFNKT